ncbi:MAG: hypothetical protein GVY24_03845 [Planctomycetes bacterium]|jgi:uncharacterized paraquat-inducible protein A|nr:hypothetical protein [Planctomycetota bacterium]
MTSSIRMICPNLKCRCVLSVPPQARGKTVRCRQCGMRIQVPAENGTPKPAAPAQVEAAKG